MLTLQGTLLYLAIFWTSEAGWEESGEKDPPLEEVTVGLVDLEVGSHMKL